MQNVNRKLSKVGSNVQNLGASLSTAITLPVLGLGAAMVSAASDAEETNSKFNTVFRDIADKANKSADELKNSYGLSGQASKQLLGDTGDLLTGFGFTQQSALDLSTEVNKLAVDLASFTNFSGGAEGASQALTKALLGERESVKSLGISILEADVKAKVLENTQKGLTFESERQAKAYATLQLAQEQSKNAIGDYARTNQSFANQMRLVSARLNDVAVEFGELILPYVTTLANKLTGLIQKFSDLSPTTKKWILILGGVAAAIGPILALAGTILPALATGFTVLTGPIGLILAGLTAIGVVIYKNWEPIKKTLIDIANYFVDLYNESTAFKVSINLAINAFKALFEVGKFVFEGIKSLLVSVVDGFKDGFTTVGALIKAVLTGKFEALPAIIKNAAEKGRDNFKVLTNNLGNDFDNLLAGIKENTNETLASITSRKKLAYVKENVDASGITEAVKEATVQGLQQGGQGAAALGRAKETGLSTGLQSAEAVQIESPLTKISANLPNQINLINEQMANWIDRLTEFKEQASAIVESAAENFAVGFGEIVAGIANGSAGLNDVVKLMLTTMGDMAIQLGKLAISTAIAIGAIKKALASLNPAVALAAGIALVALGTLVKSAAANIGKGKEVPAFADGGIVGGSSFYGDKILARVNSGELILNQKQQQRLFSMLQTSNGNSNPTVELNGGFRITGDQLDLVLERSQKKRNRIT